MKYTVLYLEGDVPTAKLIESEKWAVNADQSISFFNGENDGVFYVAPGYVITVEKLAT